MANLVNEINTLQAVRNVSQTVLENLEHQHDWTNVQLMEEPGTPRMLIRGLPPKRLYLHPDDQIAALAHEEATGEKLHQHPEYEWVLPVHLSESWSLAQFAAVFDSLPEDKTQANRILLATVHSDSTIVYYIMHEGMVKPRQN